ncbi:MAG TPA: bifunctional 23S rRNA (guanine(2069)-N(7))-methyltransferase RlmK/23S rRNA (guanine(2445)-N(2))-methyltransferase RlmL, partial [Steroidobacteraceae bacterium]|nr:bifunctional 23S rRNA (guanine(2069)-N(7))-methyltransferase RlmK/23S rRNA (guanine(2445)-N(2))-methyltransferase RlmL [Steroidobacteraceae bacterium]
SFEHSHYAALRVKDGIVDRLREMTGSRPSVDTDAPDLRIHVHAQRRQLTVSIDLAGESLHQRGYRARSVAAPLKENLAAGILLRAGWRKIVAAGGAFLDPMCGSGTLPIEAAMIACDIAPGLSRERFGFEGWRQHDADLWRRLQGEAEERSRDCRPRAPLRGFDHDSAAVGVAIQNLERAGLRGVIHVERRDLAQADRGGSENGLLCINPPYGERLGSGSELEELYTQLGARLRDEFVGWQAAVLTGNPQLGHALRMHAVRSHALWNGPIECRLLRFDIDPRRFVVEREHAGVRLNDAATARARPGAQMFANRLTKNLRELESWARKEDVSCYRVYDADMPEYAFAIDRYQGEQTWLNVQEYQAPRSIDAGAVRARRDEALSVLPELFAIGLDKVHLRTRRRTRRGEQYERRGNESQFVTVAEGGLKFLVNFTDYLDTGLFLDHRPTRAMIREAAAGKRFLNLFCYTGSATVYAAAGGARTTTSIDLSNTYLDWARRNLEINQLAGKQHQLLRADCLAWLEEQVALGEHGPRFGLVFLDPPTFSNSKRMDEVLDVQRDHVELIRRALALLTPDGELLFSTNFERFRLDQPALAEFEVQDVSAATIPRDFARSPRIHQCFRIRRRRGPDTQ